VNTKLTIPLNTVICLQMDPYPQNHSSNTQLSFRYIKVKYVITIKSIKATKLFQKVLSSHNKHERITLKIDLKESHTITSAWS